MRATGWAISAAIVAFSCGLAAVAFVEVGQSQETSPPAAEGPHQAPDRGRRALLRGLNPRRYRVTDGTASAALEGGLTAELSLDIDLQEHAAGVLEQYGVPFGSLVALDPSSGRVLAYVSHSTANPGAPDLALDPTPPAASVFKVISASALIDAGVNPDAQVCYHGGARRLRATDLVDSERDRRCDTLSGAVGSSINAIIAKLAVRHLDQPTLERYASAFGFGHAIPFDVPTRASRSEVPNHQTDRLEFARTSAGFWHMHLSPLHGAVIAGTLANGGLMMRPTLVDRVVAEDGAVMLETRPESIRQAVSRRTARRVGRMMERTCRDGTARSAFFDPQGRPFLPGIRVAGKTGTLAGTDPYRGYTWWVGFAPADAPVVAVAALIVNTPRWRIKASYLAREALRHFLVERPRSRTAPRRTN